MELLRRIYNKLGAYLGEKDRKLYPLYNINLDITISQKRVAFVYSNSYMFSLYKISEIKHSNSLSFFSKLHYFLENNYIIDLYECHPSAPDVISHDVKYDVIIGFGKLYTVLCRCNHNAIKILYISENAPWVVEEKFKQRLEYYEQRHNKRPYTVKRKGYYTKEMFELSDYGIAGNGSMNIEGMKPVLSNIYPIKISAIFNQKYTLQPKNHTNTRKHFVWFGSSGAIHKGLDILIDVFCELPELTLDVFGALPSEIKEFCLPKNVHNCGFVNVSSDEFINNVVLTHTFVVSTSCSEALQSSVSTCMAHGLIPIVTPETGFDDVADAIICSDYRVEAVKEVIQSASQMDPTQLEQTQERIYNYTRKEFSVKAVDDSFREIMNQILI